MQLIERQIRQVRDEVSDAGRACADPVGEELVRRVQALISASIGVWETVKDWLAACPPRDPEQKRTAAQALRLTEQTFAEAIELAERVAEGRSWRSIGRLRTDLREVRRMIVLPTARRMAARDPDGRTADELADVILAGAEFEGGRPVLTPELTAQLPCPFDPEPPADVPV